MTTYYRIGLAGAIVAAGCAGHVQGRTPASVAPNTLSAAEPRGAWRPLFDGKTFNGWRGLGYDSVPTAHWKIDNGAIKKIASGQIPRLADGQPAAGGDLMTKETFTDFELSWEWKISAGGTAA
jgi:hypothetical protein